MQLNICKPRKAGACFSFIPYKNCGILPCKNFAKKLESVGVIFWKSFCCKCPAGRSTLRGQNAAVNRSSARRSASSFRRRCGTERRWTTFPPLPDLCGIAKRPRICERTGFSSALRTTMSSARNTATCPAKKRNCFRSPVWKRKPFCRKTSAILSFRITNTAA